MRYSVKILITVIFSILAFANAANAGLIIESADQVLGKQIYEPGFGTSRNFAPQQPSVIYNDKNSSKYRFNYDQKAVPAPVAEEEQVQQPEIQIVDLIKYTTTLVLSEGQFLAVRLDEEASAKWNFENRGRSLEFVKSEKRGDIVIMLYRAKAFGNSRVNFDKMENGLAVASKVLQIKVL